TSFESFESVCCSATTVSWIRSTTPQLSTKKTAKLSAFRIVDPFFACCLVGSCQVNFGFGFDDEEGVGIGAAGGTEFFPSVIEGIGEDGEDDFAFEAADEIETALLLDELETGGHFSVARLGAIGSIHRIGKGIKRKLEARDGNFDLYQIGTDATERTGEEFGGEFATESVATETESRKKRGAATGEGIED